MGIWPPRPCRQTPYDNPDFSGTAGRCIRATSRGMGAWAVHGSSHLVHPASMQGAWLLHTSVDSMACPLPGLLVSVPLGFRFRI